MTPYYIVLFLITLVNSEFVANSTNCGGFQANLILKDVIGTWHVVAIIPEKMFPERQVTCYKIEISETDEAGLRWLINKTVESPKPFLQHDAGGIIVRQRYHSESPFDVWSKSVDGIKGCFQQVISMDIGKNDVHKTLKHDAMMQLHLLEVEGRPPFLLQMLWGRMIAAVIYRREQGVTRDELKPAFELMNKLRGPQRTPKICDNALKDLLVF
ncbi:unnamed protein product [Arctia plantaginis]|uniref:Uncharacterized protein n=1 Tax=Arctia plantaginis TaxID=874455 RepID=A0A8S0ZPL6_ARCPL|nr:unnamed protein product [Arctia plantaginis]CAB3238193.1 unnamed protein product [Arctia plantaginis]